MTTLLTVLAIGAMIYACVLLIQLANARHAMSPTAAQPHRWRLHRRSPAARPTLHRP
ncbi:hypothetical protein [Streptacidiphilus neutrinimicus]|uniref:hypothetical protein n=1 Tax=Streptacidiphilus neutrinimicus TaxID=105420 RepID=UPI000B226BA1|nr:hypothetical protein [Streptacidiphilus neutrinimicus]